MALDVVDLLRELGFAIDQGNEGSGLLRSPDARRRVRHVDGPVVRITSRDAAESGETAGPLRLVDPVISRAMGDGSGYRVIDGQMVRLLLHAYPTERSVHRSTLDADAAVDGVGVIGPIATQLEHDGFRRVQANTFLKRLDGRGGGDQPSPAPFRVPLAACDPLLWTAPGTWIPCPS